MLAVNLTYKWLKRNISKNGKLLEKNVIYELV